MTPDRYWEEAFKFSRSFSRTVLGNPCLASVYPKIHSFTLPFDAQLVDAIICHKGLLEEIPLSVLRSFFGLSTIAFANEVFVGFKVEDVKVRSAKDAHRRSFFDKFRSIGGKGSREMQPDMKQRSSCYLGDYTVLTTSIFGHKLLVDSRDISLTPHLINDGYWELWITKFVKSVIRPGMHAVEIGSNCGYYSLLIADAIGPSGSFVAFEANPRMHLLTQKNLEINGLRNRSNVINKAVGNSEGPTKFYVFRDHIGSSSLFDLSGVASQFTDELYAIDVEMTTLEKALGSDAQIDFLKIDAEGAEPMIFEAAWAMIERSRNIQMVVEFSPGSFSDSSVARKYLEQFTSRGFKIRSIETDSRAQDVSIDTLLSSNQRDLFLTRN